MNKAIFLILTGLTLQVFATEYTPDQDQQFDSLVARGGFYQEADVPIGPAHLNRAIRATVRLGKGSTCSAVILSKDGYVATAAHCIDDCILTTYNSKPDLKLSWIRKASLDSPMEELSHKTDMPPRPTIFEVLEFHERVPAQLKCSEYVQTTWTLWDYDLQNPEIVWLGRGVLTDDEKSLIHVSDAEFDRIKDINQDIAILKYHRKGGAGEVPCIPVAKVNAPKDSATWAIGFPVRGPGHVYDGYHKLVSLGRVRDSIEVDPVLKGYAGDMSAQDADVMWKQQKALWNRDSLFLTSLDAAHGNSGGSIVNEKGELVAILTDIMRSDAVPNGGTTIGASVPYVRGEVVKALGEAKAGEIFNCPSEESQVSN